MFQIMLIARVRAPRPLLRSDDKTVSLAADIESGSESLRVRPSNP
jgi:hypothetical protein